MTTYWHMQMHPDSQDFAFEHTHSILEDKKIIGLGNWEEGKGTITKFVDEIKVNDIVAIKNGSALIALVQVIGGAYHVNNEESDISWIEFRRPIRVLDWELWDKKLPQPRGTLMKCVDNDADTTKIIKEWHKRVVQILEKRGLPVSV
ncbi:TPA: hypothetical protein ACF2YT_001645 [Providencia alcalifaciens]